MHYNTWGTATSVGNRKQHHGSLGELPNWSQLAHWEFRIWVSIYTSNIFLLHKNVLFESKYDILYAFGITFTYHKNVSLVMYVKKK